MKFPALYKIVEYHQQHSSKFPCFNFGVVKNGFLVVGSETVLVRIPLKLYTHEVQASAMEGALLGVSELKSMHQMRTVTGTRIMAYTRNNTYRLANGKEITYPDFEGMFENHLSKKPKFYAAAGINHKLLETIGGCFQQSLDEEQESFLIIEQIETDEDYMQGFRQPYVIRPMSNPESGEVALMMPAVCAYSDEINRLV